MAESWKEIWNSNPNDYVELNEVQVFEEAKKNLLPIQQNLLDKRITIDDAKQELQKINERLQWANIDTDNKKELWNAFDKLLKLEKDVDESNLQAEVSEIVKVLENLTKNELSKLRQNIQNPENKLQNSTWYKGSIWNRPPEVQKWLEKATKSFDKTIADAKKDGNLIARTIWKWMEKLNS